MATRATSEEVDLYDILKTEFLKTTGLIPGDAVHILLSGKISYRDEEVGIALTRLFTEGYIRLFYRHGSGLYGAGSSCIGFVLTEKPGAST